MSETDPQETLDTRDWQPRQDRNPTATEKPLSFDPRAYDLLEELGKGGMGEVYRTRDPALGRDLAIKVMKEQFRSIVEAESRFLREARITGLLQHPGIVSVHNLGRLADGRLHYTMRLVYGKTFANILAQEAGQAERLPSLLAIFEKVCQAVAYAHSKRVIHRDLKPANVMVGQFGEVQVMDWGLAKVLMAEGEPADKTKQSGTESTWISADATETPSDMTQAGSSLGTPAYMSPEQALGEWDTVDERTDVFALGAILYEILIGRPPYSGRDGYEVLRRARRGDLAEALAQLEKCLADASLRALCRECLSPEPDGRPRDAGAVAIRVANYQMEVQERLRRVELERVAAETRAREEQARAIVERERAEAERRAKWRMFALLLMMVAFLGLGIFSSWWIIREREARAADILARQVADAQEKEAGNYWVRGRDLYEKGLIEEAIAEFRDAIRAKSDYAPAHNFLGVALSAQGKLDEAIASFKRSIESDPTFSYPQFNLGIALRKKGDVEGAIACLKKAIELEPRNANPHDYLGDVLVEKGLLDEAVAEYREAVRLAPEDEDFHFDLAECLRQKGQLEDAITEYRESIRLEPDKALFHSSLGKALDAKAHLQEAITEYRKAIQLLSKEKGGAKSIGMANTLALLGSDLLKLQKYPEAEAVLRDSLTILQQKEPDEWTTFETRSLLGGALLGQKKYAEAESLLTQGYEGMKQRRSKIPSEEIDKLNEALERLVLLYETTGNKEKASHWRKILSEAKAAQKKPKP